MNKSFSKERSLPSITVPLTCTLTLCLLTPVKSVDAQILPDNTLGAESSRITPNITINSIPSDRIDGGAIRGVNLFHSFFDFNIAPGRGAYFSNPAGIANIFSRITGINPSTIQGTLGVLGNANLFLINPNGIIFGQNARLNVNGSFVASTASAVTFADGTFFSATEPQITPLLTINIPIGLQYRGNAGNILVQGSRLQVPNGKTLALVGGNLNLEGATLGALGGRVELGGVGGTGTIELSVNGTDIGLSFPDGVVPADVSLTNRAFVTVSASGGGSIAINARNLNIAGESELLAGIAPGLGSSGAIAGDISVHATEAITLSDRSLISNVVQSQAVGQGGDINITTKSLLVTNNSQLGASTLGQGNAGSINILARDAVAFGGEDSNGGISRASSTVGTTGVGNSGSVNITTGLLSLTNGAQLTASTRGQGNAGNVNIVARDRISFDGVNSRGFSSGALSQVLEGATGNGGSINITTGSLSVTNGARLSANTGGRGNAGNVIINARDTVLFDGVGSNGISSDAGSVVSTTAVGNGGSINITAGSLFVSNGALLSAETRGLGNAGNVTINVRDHISFDGVGPDGQSSAAITLVGSTGVGNGGNINITTGSLSVTNSAQLLVITAGQGNAGNVIIFARDTVSFDGEKDGFPSAAFSAVEPGAIGKGGDINITTGSLFLTNGAQLITSTQAQGDAGNVNIIARDTVSFDGASTTVFSDVDDIGVGKGGNINITTQFLSVTNGAALLVNSAGNGAAGNINVDANSIRLDNQAILSADTVGGQGNITLRSVDLVLRRDSSITTNAQGNNVIGGNINIDTGVLVALENSDITANSRDFRGGNVNVTAQGIFGTAFRPVQTPNSDITATGADSSLNGNVTINRFGIDPTGGLVVLPENLIDPATLIAQNPCERGKGSAFVITGRGGLPANPGEPLNSDAVRVGLVEPALSLTSQEQTQTTQLDTSEISNSTSQIQQAIVPAQGWVFNKKGEVVLTAYNPTSAQTQRPWQNPTTCPSEKI
jgi:filamentous hemagglutinin family protein